MIKSLKTLVKFVYNDFKNDFLLLIDIVQGKAPKKNWEDIKLSNFNLEMFLKDYWLPFLMLLLAFSSGIFVSSQHYQDKCNQAIIDRFPHDEGSLIGNLPINNYTFNDSELSVSPFVAHNQYVDDKG